MPREILAGEKIKQQKLPLDEHLPKKQAEKLSHKKCVIPQTKN